jgi:hypothetical protein
MSSEAPFEFPAAPPADGAPVARLALRDAAIALAALSLWAAADAWYAVTGLGAAAVLSILDGLLVGAAVTLLAHEWGHFAGARLAGGIAPTIGITAVFPLFHFDMQKSPARAFRSMSVAGNAAHWLVVLVIAVGLPLDTPGRIALLCAAFGYAVFGSTTEIPVIRRAFAGASPVESFVGLTGAVLRRNRWVGAGAALVLFLVLA